MMPLQRKRKITYDLEHDSQLYSVTADNWKPDITVKDLKQDLREASSMKGMFTLLGICYIQDNNPARFKKLLEAARNINRGPYMTRNLYSILRISIQQYNMCPHDEWVTLLNLSSEGLKI